MISFVQSLVYQQCSNESANGLVMDLESKSNYRYNVLELVCLLTIKPLSTYTITSMGPILSNNLLMILSCRHSTDSFFKDHNEFHF